jgi:putative two-component system response regulator
MNRTAILIVEDEEEIREAINSFLSGMGNDVAGAGTAEEGLELLARRRFDLLITDLKLPGIDGIELCRRARQSSPGVSIVVITAYGNIASALEAIEHGVEEYLLKPFSIDALRHAVQRVLEKRMLVEENRQYVRELEREVADRALEIDETGRSLGRAFYKTLHILGNSLECREAYLRGRTERVTIYSLRIAQELGWDYQRIGHLMIGAPISDIGKLSISEEVLTRPDPLSPEEMALVRSHVETGVHIINSLIHFREVIPIIRYHHERIDGSGYPEGLKGDEIPEAARIVAIADSFDAMTHFRPWRPAIKAETALAEIADLAGRSYDEEFVAAFLRAVERHGLDELVGIKPTRQFYELTLPMLESYTT